MIAIGIGCRKGASADDIAAMVRDALARLGRRGDLQRLFSIVDKRGEPGLAGAAAQLGMPLVFLDRAVLQRAAGRAQSRSRHVEDRFGLPSIAETAALAGAGDGAVLLVERICAPTVTCAIAGPPP